MCLLREEDLIIRGEREAFSSPRVAGWWDLPEVWRRKKQKAERERRRYLWGCENVEDKLLLLRSKFLKKKKKKNCFYYGYFKKKTAFIMGIWVWCIGTRYNSGIRINS